MISARQPSTPFALRLAPPLALIVAFAATGVGPTDAGVISWRGHSHAIAPTEMPWVLGTFIWDELYHILGNSTATAGLPSIAALPMYAVSFEIGAQILVDSNSPGATTPGFVAYTTAGPDLHTIFASGTPILTFTTELVRWEVASDTDSTIDGATIIHVVEPSTPMGEALYAEIMAITNGRGTGRLAFPGFSHVDIFGGFDLTGSILFEPPANPADVNDDGAVDSIDLSVILGAWGSCTDCPADINSDGLVNGDDMTLLLAAWG